MKPTHNPQSTDTLARQASHMETPPYTTFEPLTFIQNMKQKADKKQRTQTTEPTQQHPKKTPKTGNQKRTDRSQPSEIAQQPTENGGFPPKRPIGRPRKVVAPLPPGPSSDGLVSAGRSKKYVKAIGPEGRIITRTIPLRDSPGVHMLAVHMRERATNRQAFDAIADHLPRILSAVIEGAKIMGTTGAADRNTLWRIVGLPYSPVNARSQEGSSPGGAIEDRLSKAVARMERQLAVGHQPVTVEAGADEVSDLDSVAAGDTHSVIECALEGLD